MKSHEVTRTNSKCSSNSCDLVRVASCDFVDRAASLHQGRVADKADQANEKMPRRNHRGMVVVEEL